MQKINVLPHPELCPNGKTFEAKEGLSICNALLSAGINIEHACEQSCACTTCHVIIRNGFAKLNNPNEEEEDLLDKAWGLEANSRLSCQAIIKENCDLVIEIPKYSINHVREGKA